MQLDFSTIQSIPHRMVPVEALGGLAASRRAAPVASPAAPAGDVPPWKRMLDVTLILLGAPAVVGVGVVLAVYIKLVSSGPVLFRQERVGHHRKRFTCYKFRSMKTGCDTRQHEGHLRELVRSGLPMTKLDAGGDPRLIPGAAFLRASGLDELPQLINVMAGEMSLVGPRPCTPDEAEAYDRSRDGRFDTLPGLTGLWQVSGKNRTTFAEMVALDMHYASTKSLGLDLRILSKTMGVVLGQLRETFARRWATSTATELSQRGAEATGCPPVRG